jgi:hypothetical protein
MISLSRPEVVETQEIMVQNIQLYMFLIPGLLRLFIKRLSGSMEIRVLAQDSWQEIKGY